MIAWCWHVPRGEAVFSLDRSENCQANNRFGQEIFPDPFSGGYLMGKFMVLINDFG